MDILRRKTWLIIVWGCLCINVIGFGQIMYDEALQGTKPAVRVCQGIALITLGACIVTEWKGGQHNG